MGDVLKISQMSLHLLVNAIWAGTAFYIFHGYVIVFFEKTRYVRYLFISAVVCLGCAVVFLPLHFLIKPDMSWVNLQLAMGSTVGTFIIGQCGSLVRGFENWTDSLKHKAEIENRHLRTENELLKSQISPHFLFNTLNNIDSFIAQEPQKASETLISLSQILRYIIYETKTELVPLANEIECIRNYIHLQRIRLTNEDAVNVSLPEVSGNSTIAPLILLPFIENAFKHATQLNATDAIKIKLELSDGYIHFTCFNTCAEDQLRKQTGGFGLENVKRRLELLYKKHYTLDIEKTSCTFEVKLTIHLH
jgi:two-component system, LytTR family, sensor kinase